MNCKRCGSPLPSSGFTCNNCGAMMDSDQIKLQKEIMNNNIKKNDLPLSQKYGNKKEIFIGRNKEENKFRGIGIFLCILLFIFLIIIIVYFI